MCLYYFIKDIHVILTWNMVLMIRVKSRLREHLCADLLRTVGQYRNILNRKLAITFGQLFFSFEYCTVISFLLLFFLLHQFFVLVLLHYIICITINGIFPYPYFVSYYECIYFDFFPRQSY